LACFRNKFIPHSAAMSDAELMRASILIGTWRN
jgi:hypothetical protein